MSGARNKSVLAARQRALQLYARVLPSLELKRRQLLVRVAQEKRLLAQTRTALDEGVARLAERVPMLASASAVVVDALQTDVRDVMQREAGAERVLGIPLPLVEIGIPPARVGAELAQPAWVDMAREGVLQLAALRRQLQLREERLHALSGLLRRTVQRVNLLEQRLVPQAKADIQRIRDALADEERAAIVRAKRVRQALARREAA